MGRVSPDELAYDVMRKGGPSYVAEVLRWHLAMGEERPHRLGGPGPTTSRAFQRRQARAMFLGALYRLKPDLTGDLLTPELTKLAVAHLLARTAWRDAIDPGVPLSDADEIFDVLMEGRSDPTFPALKQATEELYGFIHAWTQRYGLTEKWFDQAILGTAEIAHAIGRYGADLVAQNGLPDGVPDPLPLLLGEFDLSTGYVHEGLEWPVPPDSGSPFRSIGDLAPHRQIHRTLWVDDLKYPTIENEEGYWEDDGGFETYDWRTESIADATERVLKELRPRVRAMLQRIANEDDTLNDAVKTRTIGPKPFEWLARNLMLGEHTAAIAEITGDDSGNISKGLAEAADLLGIDRSRIVRHPGGRPRSRRPDRQLGPVRIA